LTGRSFHAPVLSGEAIEFLLREPGGIYIDGTLGGGGHAEAILSRLSGGGRVIAFDLDEEAIRFAAQRLEAFSSRLTIIRANFNSMRPELESLAIRKVDGILLDLGVSSFQLDNSNLGFSFRGDGDIDMRMDRRQTLTGWDVVNSYREEELREILWTYGEERHGRRIAKKIVAARPIGTTVRLRDVVGSAVGGRFLTKTLARVFQAIRIEVNSELSNLETALRGSLELLAAGGRIAVISYHSLEDRIVKRFFREHPAEFRILTKKPVVPSDDEIAGNTRARSARLRAAERLPDQ
jgi:16S rRNA (cytosine1402-N4)-methyltransferase